MNFESIKRYFDNNLWSVPMVKAAVKRGVITKEEYTEITGLQYE